MEAVEVVIITEYQKHHFAVVNRKLRCNACSEIISEKKSSIEKHQIQEARERPVRDCKKQIGEPDNNGMFAEEG